MSNPPPIQPPQDRSLNYGAPAPSRKNSPGMIFLRIFLGAVAGFGASLLGIVVASVTNNGWLFFVPFTAALAAAIFVAVRFRRFGYVTGLFIGPFIVVGCVFMLLLLVCGGYMK